MIKIDAPLLHSFINGGYKVSLHADGTKVRETLNAAIPPKLPEQMDLKITDWCDAGCAWCHEKSTKKGQHGDVDAMLKLLKPLNAGTEIAIGGGDPLSHPDFDRLVLGLRDMGLIPNVTVNGRHLERHLAQLEKLIEAKAIYGVGISLYKELPKWEYEHKVIHVINGVDSPEILDDAASQKLLILGYKNFGRGMAFRDKNDESVRRLMDQWYRELIWVVNEHHVSFDTLAIAQLKPQRLVRRREDFEMRYMGDEGQFSMYVDGVTQTYSISSYGEERPAWTDIEDMFKSVRVMKDPVKAT